MANYVSRGPVVSNINFPRPGVVIAKAMTCSLIVSVSAKRWTSMVSVYNL